MAKLTAAQRDKLPAKDFAIPPTKNRKGKYPINDKAHQKNAKSRATQMENKGYISESTANMIKAKANKLLRKRAV